MLVKSSGLLGKIQETYPRATQDQIDSVLVGGDESEVLNKASKLQSVLDLVGAMQAPIENVSTAPIGAGLSAGAIATTKKKGGRMTKAKKLEAQAVQAQSQAVATEALISSRATGAIEAARSQIATIDDLEDGISVFVAGRIVGMDASIAGKTAAIVDEAGDTCVVDMGGITRRSVDAALDSFYAEVS